jgi:hypothetical protein
MRVTDHTLKDAMWANFNAFSYKFSFWTATTLIGLLVVGAFVIPSIFLGLHAVFILLDAGSAWFGSGTLDLSAGLPRLMDQFWAQVTANRTPLTVSALAACGLPLVLDHGPFTRLFASLGCIALQILLIGAMF